MPDEQGAAQYRPEWISQLGSTSDDYAFGIAADRLGGIYIAGQTLGDLGGDNAGSNDTWVAKYDSNGDRLWTQQLGTLEGDRAYNLNTDSAGNLYLTGTTSGTLGENSAGSWDAWIAKYDDNGNQLWLQQFGSNTTDDARSTAVDSAGNVYLAGSTWGDLASSNAGSWDAWIAQYDSNGNQVWAKQLGTEGEDYGHTITVDNQGNAYLAGYTQGNLFGSNAGSWDAWIAKYDSSGNQVWAKQLGTEAEDQAKGIGTDSQGNVYVTGWTSGAMSESQGSFDAWMAKYDSSGNQLWMQQLGSAGSEGALDLTIDSEDRIYLSGNTWGDLADTNAGENDAWVAEYDRDGNRLWMQQLGTEGNDSAFGVAVGEPGKLYIGGWTDGAFTENSGGTDGWLAQLLPNNAPELSDFSVETEEAAEIIFTAEHFLSAFADSDGDTLVKVQITSLPENGTLTLDGSPVTENQEIEVDRLEALKFIPKFAFTGNTSFTWNGDDGMNYAASSATVNLTVSTNPNEPPEIEWIRQFGTADRDNSSGVAVDDAGHVYLTGGTSGDLGGANAGANDAWVAKYDSEGNQLWLQQFGTNSEDYFFDVAVDGASNVYLTGYTSRYLGEAFATFGNALVVKYDSEGNQLWVQQFGTGSEEESKDVAIDRAGNVYLTGFTWGDLDGIKAGSGDVWVAKYNSEGNQLWIRQFGSADWDESYGVAVDDTGNVYLTGTTSGYLSDSATWIHGVWVAKYDPQGNQLWVQQFESTDWDGSSAVVVDDAGNVYLTGSTGGNLGGLNAGVYDAWVAKYDSQGNQLWVQQFGSAGSDYSSAVAVDDAGNLYLTGRTYGDLGRPNAGASDVWVAKYDPEGNQLWVQQFGTVSWEDSNGVAVDDAGNLYLTGGTEGDLGDANAEEHGSDAWVAKFNQNAIEAPGAVADGEADDRLGNVSVFLNAIAEPGAVADSLTGATGNEVLLDGSENDPLISAGSDDRLGNVSVFLLSEDADSQELDTFVDGNDFLQLADGLTFDDLTILPSSEGTLINVGDRLLATLNGIDASLISEEDFIF